jgi:hypothetical protein
MRERSSLLSADGNSDERMALGGSLGLDVFNFDVGRCAMICNPPESIYCGMCPDCLTDQRARRVDRLVVERGMTATAAAIVVDAAMFGIGCLEGEVRARIEAQKNKETNEPNSEGSARSVEGKPN